MAISQIVAGARAVISDVNQYYSLLKGSVGDAITLVYNAAGSIKMQPSSDPAAGTEMFQINNNAGTRQIALTSDGKIKFADATTMSTVGDGNTQPNLVLNSDFSRRTVFGLAMPEVFADTSGYTVISGAAPTVAANIVTSTAANELAWCAGTFVWRDGRASATFKAVATAGIYQLKFRVDANVWLSAKQNNGNFTMAFATAGADVVGLTVAQALTLNRWYWLEIDVQAGIATVKLYDTGGTVSGVTKASSTLLQTLSATGLAPLTGATVAVKSDQATAQWGGIATGNGGVYVETWLPESFPVTFGGTLGGQAVGYDESTDAGPISRQFPIRTYIPQAARTITMQQYGSGAGSATTVANVSASTPYAGSIYVKTSGYGGSDSLWTADFYDYDMTPANPHFIAQLTATGAESTWTRKSGTATSASTGRISRILIRLNAALTATGTAYFQLPQYEQGSAATAWRNAPADDGAITWELTDSTNPTTTSTTTVEVNSRDLAGNLFLPWDANVVSEFVGIWRNGGAAGSLMRGNIAVDGTTYGPVAVADTMAATASDQPFAISRRSGLAAGKHRMAAHWYVSTNTGTMDGTTFATVLRVTAYRGK